MKNNFYIFEGIDGCGKTSLIDALKEKVSEKNFYFTREPFGTDLKIQLKDLLHKTIDKNDYLTQYLLFATERSYHIKNIILPKLKEGVTVISDRFFYSSLAYQGMNIDEEIIQSIYDKTNQGITIKKIFFCTMSHNIALQRIEKRNLNDPLDEYFKNQLLLLSQRYQAIFSSLDNVIYLDMNLPIPLLIEKVLKEINN
jgi:dTMP kinase